MLRVWYLYHCIQNEILYKKHFSDFHFINYIIIHGMGSHLQ